MADDINARTIQDFARDIAGWLIKGFAMAIWTEQAVRYWRISSLPLRKDLLTRIRIDRRTIQPRLRVPDKETRFRAPQHHAAVFRPGTMLACERGGGVHRVMVMGAAFSQNGKTYDSLSKATFAIREVAGTLLSEALGPSAVDRAIRPEQPVIEACHPCAPKARSSPTLMRSGIAPWGSSDQ